MSYNSKKTITSVVAGVLLNIAYIIYALGEHSPAPDNLKSWAIAMLVFIGIGIAAVIVIQIIFHIVTAIGIAIKEHERDKLISLKSTHIGYVFVGIGFVVALAELALGMSSVVALHTLLGAFSVGSIAEGIASICFYEKGVRNG